MLPSDGQMCNLVSLHRARTRPLGSLPRPVLKCQKHMTTSKLSKDNRLTCEFLSLCAEYS